VSLAARIFILIGLVLVLVAGGELANGLVLRQERLDEARRDVAALARIAELDVDRILEGARQTLATLAKLPADHGWDERACAVIEATASSDFEYDHIAAVDYNGVIRCSSNSGSPFLGTSMPVMDLFDRIVATSGFSVGSYGVGQLSGNEVIRVGYPVVDAAGTVIGAVYAGINLTWLNTAATQWQLGTATSIQIADGTGIIIAQYPDPQRVGHPMGDDLKPLLFAPEGGSVEVKGTDGTIRVYGYEPVSAGPSSDVAVFVGRDKAPVSAAINRSTWLNEAVILIGLSLSGAFVWAYLQRCLTRPLQNLQIIMGRWRDGDWSARAGTTSGVPEFDHLASAFDNMANVVSAQITERDIIQQKRAADLERFRFIFESASDGMFVSDAETGCFTDVNEAGCAMFGFLRDELLGSTIGALSSDVAPYTQADALARLETDQSAPFEWHCKTKDGRLFWVEISPRTVQLDDRSVGLAVVRDVTERRRLHDEITHQAHFDVLTGLPNRRDFEEVFEQEVTRSARYDRSLCVAMGDIDLFKEVNDTYGHGAGDVVLKELGELMRNRLRKSDYIARWGGEEFIILLPETNLDTAAELLNRLRASIAKHVVAKIGRAVTLSFGVSEFASADTPDDVVKRVDQALYRSKETGRNKVTCLPRAGEPAAVPRQLHTVAIDGIAAFDLG